MRGLHAHKTVWRPSCRNSHDHSSIKMARSRANGPLLLVPEGPGEVPQRLRVAVSIYTFPDAFLRAGYVTAETHAGRIFRFEEVSPPPEPLFTRGRPPKDATRSRKGKEAAAAADGR